MKRTKKEMLATLTTNLDSADRDEVRSALVGLMFWKAEVYEPRGCSDVDLTHEQWNRLLNWHYGQPINGGLYNSQIDQIYSYLGA